MNTLSIPTHKREEIVDITQDIQSLVQNNSWQDGIILIYSPHTTAGISVNENYDPDVKRDMTYFLNKSIPKNEDFHHAEGNSDSHIKGALVNFSQMFIVENGKIQLGTWQGIFFMEFDGPRLRKAWIKFLGS